MENKYTLLCLLLIHVFAISFLTDEVFAEKFLLYQDNKNNISIEYPENWIKLELPTDDGGNITDLLLSSFVNSISSNITDNSLLSSIFNSISSIDSANTDIVYIINPNSTAYFTISLQSVPYDKNLETSVNALLYLIQLMPDWALIKNVPTTIANLPAENIVYTTTITDPTNPDIQSKLQVSMNYIVNGGKKHLISFTTTPELYNSFQPLMEKVIKSYKVFIPK